MAMCACSGYPAAVESRRGREQKISMKAYWLLIPSMVLMLVTFLVMGYRLVTVRTAMRLLWVIECVWLCGCSLRARNKRYPWIVGLLLGFFFVFGLIALELLPARDSGRRQNWKHSTDTTLY